MDPNSPGLIYNFPNFWSDVGKEKVGTCITVQRCQLRSDLSNET